MTNLLSSSILSTVEATRSWAEQIARDETFPQSLNGLCIRASVRLFRQLKKQGFKPKICCHVAYPRHFYIKLNGVVIDVTASQYDLEKIFVRNEQDVKYMIPYTFKNKIEFLDIGTLSHFLELADWSERETKGI